MMILKKKVKKITTSKVKAKAWKYFSLYIRLRGAKGGMNTCVTCGRVKNYKDLQAGHFLPGRHNSILFDERNCWPQCYVCNVVLGGNGPRYYQFMLKKFGQKVIDELEKMDWVTKQMKVFQFQQLADYYKEKVEQKIK